jgi:hypothetical protein
MGSHRSSDICPCLVVIVPVIIFFVGTLLRSFNCFPFIFALLLAFCCSFIGSISCPVHWLTLIFSIAVAFQRSIFGSFLDK